MPATLPSYPWPVRKSFRKALNRSGLIIRQHSTEADQLIDFASATAAGLSSMPRRLQCRFLYDARGSELFDLITRQPEYYLTRTEAEILATKARLIRKICGATTLAELGSGNSTKTDYLLRAWLAQAQSVRYVPVDVSEAALREASRNITVSHPATQVLGINSDYRSAFPLLREISPVTVLFLGSSIGNFAGDEMSLFLRDLALSLCLDDFFLLGIDLVKERHTIEAAYNDAAGITQEFTRNLFIRMNRELGSSIDPSAVQHVAVYNEAKEQVDICARFSQRQAIHIAPLGQHVIIDEGEAINTEISRKFRLGTFLPFLEGYGFTAEEIFTDERSWFALLLLRRNGFPPAVSGGTS
ncbi:L-histidine N(alpha)-methyltransferase [Geotalea toluenoxydans]|uniref:L-histidine N(alpha)-methyltransferase n=1 Tax=Geotalea toluenoxydans TaxID=421624 RepID=UPI0006D06493|nr:L-histidine N(alpha)-methyltransferase [Geotalea toluenoxydans]